MAKKRGSDNRFIRHRDEKEFEGRGSGRRHLCRCCRNLVEVSKNPNSIYCVNCGNHIQNVRWTMNQRSFRDRKELEEWKALGYVGRIKQMLEWNREAHRIIKNMRNKVRYYKKIKESK